VKISTDQISKVTVGKAPVELQQDDSYFGESTAAYSGNFYVYPGIYNVTAPNTDYLQVDAQELRANHPDDLEAAVTLNTQVTDQLSDLALDAVHKFATACVTVPTNLNEGCPSELQDKELKSFSVKTQADGVTMEGMESFSSSETTFKYQRNKTEYMEYDEQEIDRSFNGTIEWIDGQPKVIVTGSSWW